MKVPHNLENIAENIDNSRITQQLEDIAEQLRHGEYSAKNAADAVETIIENEDLSAQAKEDLSDVHEDLEEIHLSFL